MKRRKLLAFSFFPAFVRPNNGGVERLFNIYAGLSQRYDVTLISSAHLGGAREVIQHSAAFTEIRIPKDHHFADVYAELAKSVGEGDLSGPAIGKACKRFGPLHDEYLAHYSSADVIVHDSPFLVECDIFRGFDNKTRIYNSYNCETFLYRSFHSSKGRAPIIEELVRGLERDLCGHVDLLTVCAQEDADTFLKEFAVKCPISIVPNGYTPGPPPRDEHRLPDRLVFLGSAHKPNVEAARAIVDDIAPRMPTVDFHIIGSCLPESQNKNVTAHGIVTQQEKERLLRSASAAINPMTSGGGSSLKVADIASNGTPLISTELGARGFGLQAGVHYLLLDDKDPVGSIHRAQADRERLQTIAARAKAHFEQNYSWQRICDSFADMIEAVPRREGRTAVLVVNDYDSLDSVGGGATRTSGLCDGLAVTAPVIFISFASDNEPARRLHGGGRILSLQVDKTQEHLAEHDLDHSQYHISSADIVNYWHAPQNRRLMDVFRCAASISAHVVCEHPYMVGLPRTMGLDFVYSSQNFEKALKTENLRDHPRFPQLLAGAVEAETFACAAASLIIAVSERDAHDFGAEYRATAPIMVIPNGASGPAMDWAWEADRRGSRPSAIFMGSAHGPNLDAAQWIVTALAPARPDIDFVVLGSVAGALEESSAPNVHLLGPVDSAEKSRRLYSANVALNPMLSGSGSNVKMADYLQHGLPVITTAFGRRGYEWVPDRDVLIADLDAFEEAISSLLLSERSSAETRQARQAEYASKLSMKEGGRTLARLLDAHAGSRKRALYVTYRYNEPARGGGEAYVVRLVHALAANGWNVDVVSPAAEEISDVSRFAARFHGHVRQPIPLSRPRVRSVKFPLDAEDRADAAVRDLWAVQPDFEEHAYRALERPKSASLAWGWGDPEENGRWCFRNAGIHLPQPARLTLRGRTLRPLWLQLVSEEGHRLHDVEADGVIDIDIDVPSGLLHLRASMQDDRTLDDPRPLAFFVETLHLDRTSLLGDRVRDNWAASNTPAALMTSLIKARAAVRDPRELDLTPLRTTSRAMSAFVREQVGDYDLLITHNAVFGSSVEAVRAARDAGVPSVFIPHLHYDDDFYHFRDIHAACAMATRTLVCPQVTMDILIGQGLENVAFHAPGVDVADPPSDEDVRAFRAIVGEQVKDFFLVLGRKSASKGYREIIAANDALPKGRARPIVMIGPDEDGLPVRNEHVICLGQQPREVVKGALRECLALANMSSSESFGMVLVEAGLAGKPVLANANCAAFADIVENGANGFLATPADLSSRMLELIDDPELGRRLGQEGRQRALEYDWTNVERDFVNICNSLVEN